MGNGGVKRYIGGKRLEDYYKDIVKLEFEMLFKSLDISDVQGIALLKVFARMDKKESGFLKAEEILDFFGGSRTKFTDRLFAVYVDFTNDADLHFTLRSFVITCWSIFSLNARYMARFLFEMFDCENCGFLEKPDLETMYKMMFNCDDHDHLHVDMFPFKSGKIGKTEFIEHIRKKPHLVEPGIDYQKRLMTACGGVKIWEQAAELRRQKYSTLEQECKTVEAAINAIVTVNDKPEQTDDASDADTLLRMQQEKLQNDLLDAQQDFIQRENEKEELRRQMMTLSAEDMEIEKLWWDLGNARREFENTVFLFALPEVRRDRRNALFASFDRAVEANLSRLSQLEEAEVLSAEGSDEDRRTRVEVFVSSEEGQQEKDRLHMLEIIRTIKKGMTDNPGKGPAFVAKVRAVDKVLTRMETGQRQQAQAAELAGKYASKTDRATAEQGALESLGLSLTATAVAEVRARHSAVREEKLTAFKGIEHAMVMHYGSRLTRWELLTRYDSEGPYRVFLNVDTHKTYPEATAICEICDSVLDSADVKCFVCGSFRNERNAKLYKGLNKLPNVE